MQRPLFENLRLRLKLTLKQKDTQKQDSATHHKQLKDFGIVWIKCFPDPQFSKHHRPPQNRFKMVKNSSWDFRATASVEFLMQQSLECL